MSIRRNIMLAVLAAAAAFAVATAWQVSPVSLSITAADNPRITDRNGVPLAVSYQNRWNDDTLSLHDVPSFLRDAFIQSEDRRFFEHSGVDWRARASALRQNISSGNTIRGASTITEQVVRMVNPRPRSLWSKWLEGIEATLLESRASKAEIFEFYLNQVPYAANRRGVKQAARYYFDRDLSTLTKHEMLMLAVLVRAPSAYDPYRYPDAAAAPIGRLAKHIGVADADIDAPLQLARPQLPVHAGHFAAWLRGTYRSDNYRATLDAGIQAQVQKIIDDRVAALKHRKVRNAAAIVIDHHTGDILAWVVSGATDAQSPTRMIDAVTVPRQPGSALKPFLYAAALDHGFHAATILNDAPLAEAIGTGLHRFRNYSNVHYGRITLREALGNSLNIPALLTIHHVGVARYLKVLHGLGFKSLDRHSDVYDEGLALGNGEVTLLELATAYAALARGGVYMPARGIADAEGFDAQRIFSPESAGIIGHILSDPHARKLEFGNNSILNLPVETAAKTGTSTDYRDAWAAGYNHRFVVAVWMGNLDYAPTDGVTGAVGPALALRSIFNEINRGVTPQPLRMSPRIVRHDICVEAPKDPAQCYMRSEYFKPDTLPQAAKTARTQRFEIVKPTDGLKIAVDPRIPAARQKIEFVLRGLSGGQRVVWTVNGQDTYETGGTYLWPLSRGRHSLSARVADGDKTVHTSATISYLVK